MRILGLPIPFTGEKRKALARCRMAATDISILIIHEPFPGAWQQNVAINIDTASSFHADFACKTLIARDIAKLRVKLVEEGRRRHLVGNHQSGILAGAAAAERLSDPQSVLGKLGAVETVRGNTYVLKVRDNRNVVTALHVLDPTRVQPLVSDDGTVFYRLSSDNLAGIDDITVPAREIIHDRIQLPVSSAGRHAAGVCQRASPRCSASMRRQASALLFENASTPGGILTLPGEISQEEEQRFKEQWESRFSRVNLGRVAVMTGGAKYEKMAMTNVEGQMVES